uniref:F-box domain-containing protein n=1 Tax=Meloidogyne hapla TaxID=6305 RepID=A0A1I8BIL2_MELHA
MFYLGIEVKIDILKCLNFKQLFSVRQVNSHFNAVIDRYEKILARKEFDSFTIWENALKKHIPLYLYTDFVKSKTNFSVLLEDGDNIFILKLPKYPKTIKKLKILRCWFERLFSCAFKEITFTCVVFNSKVIKLIFYDKDLSKFQLNTKNALFCYSNPNYEKALEFSQNYLFVHELFQIGFAWSEEFKQYTKTVLKIILSNGKNFSKISFAVFSTSYILSHNFSGAVMSPMPVVLRSIDSFDLNLFSIMMRIIGTSNDCSKIMSAIEFYKILWPNFKLPNRAENVQREECLIKNKRYNLIKYKITNIQNPQFKFLIKQWHNDDENNYIVKLQIHRINDSEDFYEFKPYSR